MYPSLNVSGRFRTELDINLKREIVKDFTIGLTAYDSFDSKPPAGGRASTTSASASPWAGRSKHVVDLKAILDVGAPVLAFTTLLAVGLELRPVDFARVRSVPLVVAVGLLAPLVLLPAFALALVWWFAPDPFIAGGLLLVAACRSAASRTRTATWPARPRRCPSR